MIFKTLGIFYKFSKTFLLTSASVSTSYFFHFFNKGRVCIKLFDNFAQNVYGTYDLI